MTCGSGTVLPSACTPPVCRHLRQGLQARSSSLPALSRWTTTSRLSSGARLLHRPGDPQLGAARRRHRVSRGAARRGEAAAPSNCARCLLRRTQRGRASAGPRGGAAEHQSPGVTSHGCSRPRHPRDTGRSRFSLSVEAATRHGRSLQAWSSSAGTPHNAACRFGRRQRSPSLRRRAPTLVMNTSWVSRGNGFPASRAKLAGMQVIR